MYCYFSQPEAKFVVKKYKYKEAVIVDSVKLCSNDNGTSAKNRACITFRVPRSEHGMFFTFVFYVVIILGNMFSQKSI
jgi:hypothetical protein